jgi:ribosomal protein S16
MYTRGGGDRRGGVLHRVVVRASRAPPGARDVEVLGGYELVHDAELGEPLAQMVLVLFFQ